MRVDRSRRRHRRNLPAVPRIEPQPGTADRPTTTREVGVAPPPRRQAAGWVCDPFRPSVKDMTTITASTPTPHPAHDHTAAERPVARGLVAQLGIDTAYVLIGFPLGIVAFVLMVTGLSLGGGLLITLLGIPVLVATLFAARGLAEVERAAHPCGAAPVAVAGAVPPGAAWFGLVAAHVHPTRRHPGVARRAARTTAVPGERGHIRRRGHVVVVRAGRTHVHLLGLGPSARRVEHRAPRATRLCRHRRQPDQRLSDHRRRVHAHPAVRGPRLLPCSRRISGVPC